jgi:hypothetical protein
LTSSTDKTSPTSKTSTHEFVPTHLLGSQDRVSRLGYGAMQLAGPGVIGLPEDLNGAIEVLRRAVDPRRPVLRHSERLRPAHR